MAFEGIFEGQNVSINPCLSPGLVTGFWFTSHLETWR